MKSFLKISIATLTLLFFYTSISAQTMRVGARGGLTLASAELEDKVNENWNTDMQEYILGGTGGVVFEFNVSQRFAIQPELNFVQKGYKAEVSVGSANLTTKSILNYVEVPVFAKFRLFPGRVQMNILAGPSVGYAINGKIKTGDEKSDFDFDRTEMNRFDFGLNAGLGVSIDAGPGSLFLDARLDWGVSNLDNSANSNIHNWHNRVYNFGVGYLMPIGQ